MKQLFVLIVMTAAGVAGCGEESSPPPATPPPATTAPANRGRGWYDRGRRVEFHDARHDGGTGLRRPRHRRLHRRRGAGHRASAVTPRPEPKSRSGIVILRGRVPRQVRRRACTTPATAHAHLAARPRDAKIPFFSRHFALELLVCAAVWIVFNALFHNRMNPAPQVVEDSENVTKCHSMSHL